MQNTYAEGRNQFSQIAADCGFVGLLPTEFGSIRVTPQAKIVKEIEALDAKEHEVLLGSGVLKRSFHVDQEKLEELLDETQIKELVNEGALIETFKTIGAGSNSVILLSRKNTDCNRDLIKLIENFVFEGLMEHINPFLYVKSVALEVLDHSD